MYSRTVHRGRYLFTMDLMDGLHLVDWYNLGGWWNFIEVGIWLIGTYWMDGLPVIIICQHLVDLYILGGLVECCRARYLVDWYAMDGLVDCFRGWYLMIGSNWVDGWNYYIWLIGIKWMGGLLQGLIYD